MERKQATHPEQLCRGYPSEFRDFFAHCSAMGFEDRPDYRYLKRIFKDLFDRQGFVDDGLYDWDILKKQQEQGVAGSSVVGATVSATGSGLHANDGGDEKLQEDIRGAQSSPIAAMSGSRIKDDQPKEEVSDVKESNLNQRRSIISSIR